MKILLITTINTVVDEIYKGLDLLKTEILDIISWIHLLDLVVNLL